MARKRFISPEFFTHADLYDAEAASGLPLRLCFAGLWTIADRRGVFKWSRSIKPRVLPYDPCDILACLESLEKAGFIVRYSVDGQDYGYIPTLPLHQSFHPKERPSKDPEPPASHRLAIGNKAIDSADMDDEPEAGREKVLASRAASTSTPTSTPTPTPTSTTDADAQLHAFTAIWDAYPKRAGGNSRADALRAFRARCRDGHLPDEMLAGVRRYAQFVEASGKLGTEYVKQAATFLGPGLHFLESWDVAPAVVSQPDTTRAVARKRALEIAAARERQEATA